MNLRELRIENLRVLAQVELAPAPGWNIFTGSNGAGKTSLLEAAYLLSHGRSFRTSVREALARDGSGGYSVFGEIERSGGRVRVGLARTARGLDARIDGAEVPIGELLRQTAVLCFEPGSHELIAGTSEERRRYLDWGVFHVEHEFLPTWRRYQRALKQRNILLRRLASPAELDPWDHELARAAAPLAAMRRSYFDALVPHVRLLLVDLLPELGEPMIEFDPGFDDTQSLVRVLADRLERDLARGHTGRGPHRADWALGFAAARRRDHLSRGQQKLSAFAFVLAQARLFAERAGEWPLICLDDLASEVDAEHQRRVLRAVAATRAQVFLTGTEESSALAEAVGAPARFHVEHGRVARQG
ncbi:MAG: DNA replication/repair protein RecF [Dokdonella sp.]|uniref:DNA replication/repair protein RecF n=1 Tax=Dokdonella sp. TaxID=2291710 RepID=UPI003F81F322